MDPTTCVSSKTVNVKIYVVSPIIAHQLARVPGYLPIKTRRLALPDNRNFVLSIHVAGVVLKSLKINEV